MFLHYEEAVNWIHSRLKFGIKPGLKRMEWMMERLGSPEKNISIVHVAGTNGKGSTIAYMQNILNEADYKIGTFTSPYLETFNERISLDGQPITDEEMLKLVNDIKPLVDELEKTELGGPTEFEIITTMAFLYFGRINTPDLLLLETGLGGRLDSTNIVQPLLSIITNVGYDHMNILGNTLSEIASEKAGIIKRGVPVITGAENVEVLSVLKHVANDNKASVYILGEQIHISEKTLHQNKEVFSVQTKFGKLEQVVLTMKGEHQVKNAALAITAVQYLSGKERLIINESAIRAGLEKTIWKGRFEKVVETPTIIIDGAHNREGIESLLATINRHYHDKKIHILFSALMDKEYSHMIERLSTIASSMHFTSFVFPRAAAAVELYNMCPLSQKTHHEHWEVALVEMINQYDHGENDLFIVTGSLYFISEVREYCRKSFG
ncbi:bifunctional folylpolyglutamate synthase/dihydrofolate synthase [Metabacillus herbersteinensis]|uniref:tetrahydrofolate synthase n=1 Tax=Metabacillus herbersteinensis TaxID=283816 RepID=A0ABV6G9F3_9BACI